MNIKIKYRYLFLVGLLIATVAYGSQIFVERDFVVGIESKFLTFTDQSTELEQPSDPDDIRIYSKDGKLWQVKDDGAGNPETAKLGQGPIDEGSGSYSIISILGGGGSASGTGAISIGDSSSNTGDQAVSIGESSISTGFGPTVSIGKNTTSNGTAATALGAYADVSGGFSVGIGASTSATGKTNVAGSYAVGIGYKANASQTSSIAIGNQANAGHSESVAIGVRAASTSNKEIMLGESASHTVIGGEHFVVATGTVDPSTEIEKGSMYYNTTDNALKVYNGSSFAEVGGGSVPDPLPVDTIIEKTSDNGVSVEGVTVKDGDISLGTGKTIYLDGEDIKDSLLDLNGTVTADATAENFSNTTINSTSWLDSYVTTTYDVTAGEAINIWVDTVIISSLSWTVSFAERIKITSSSISEALSSEAVYSQTGTGGSTCSASIGFDFSFIPATTETITIMVQRRLVSGGNTPYIMGTDTFTPHTKIEVYKSSDFIKYAYSAIAKNNARLPGGIYQTSSPSTSYPECTSPVMNSSFYP